MSSAPAPPNITEIAAPTLLGDVWNWALYGVLVVQVYVYSYNFPDDRRLLKVLVYFIFIIETVQTAMSGADLYYWFASGFGQVDRLTHPHLSAFDVPIIEAVVAVTVQYFFAYRVWVLSDKKSWWIYLIISVCSVVNLTGAFIGAIYGFVHDRFANGPVLRVSALTWLIGNAIADISISLSLLYYLTRRRPGVAGERFSTSHALSKIVRLTVETNLVTSTDGVIALLMAVIYPSKNWFTCPVAILGKLYSNTLLVSLNNRISIREGSTTRDGGRRSRNFTMPSSNDASSIVHLELEKSSQASKGRQESGEDGQRGEILDIA